LEGHANTRAKIDQGSKFAALIGKCAVIGLIKQPIALADVRGGGILRDEPKERLHRRLPAAQFNVL